MAVSYVGAIMLCQHDQALGLFDNGHVVCDTVSFRYHVSHLHHKPKSKSERDFRLLLKVPCRLSADFGLMISLSFMGATAHR